jgi:acyl-CoA reductase-like NAD-dependent aldehyde dehydrogenase
MKLMYIHGEFTKGKTQGEIEVTNPATEEVLDTIPRGNAQDVESTVRSSNEAFKSWRRVGANERTRLFVRVHNIANDFISKKAQDIVNCRSLLT